MSGFRVGLGGMAPKRGMGGGSPHKQTSYWPLMSPAKELIFE
jgi:hypothetical protein